MFLVHGDIMQLACDAWLLPGGGAPIPGATWQRGVGRAPAEEVPARWGQRNVRVLRWTPASPGAPAPYLTDVGGSRRTPISWYVEAAREFLERASRDVAGAGLPRHGRARPLLALPLVGTGEGGKSREAGAVARELLPALYAHVEAADVDVALVMIEGAAYSAVQSVRREHWSHAAFAELEPRLVVEAERLADRAMNGGLVLFLGAGVGAGAGLPLWANLLEELARDAARIPDAALEHLRRLSTLDRAQLIEQRLRELTGEAGGEVHSGEARAPGGAAPGSPHLSEAVARLLRARSTHYSLSHALLSALPVDEVVTTNYDTLFEAATRAAARELVVLPYDRLGATSRWLLKLHGCVEHPGDIVLTRESFLAYREQREALAGIVQALLITREMLFVGFSLDDDNFHHIVRAVRRAVARTRSRETDAREPFGTSLVVSANPLTEELWRGAIRWVPVGESSEPADTPLAARRLEVFLDLLAAKTSFATTHLFDRRYDEVLGPGERELRELFLRLVAEASPGAKKTAAWGEVERLLVRLGWRGP